MLKSPHPKHYSDYKKVKIDHVIYFLMKHGYSEAFCRESDYVLVKGDYVIFSKDEVATYKQVKDFLEKIDLNVDDFNMYLESIDSRKECEDFIRSLDEDKRPRL